MLIFRRRYRNVCRKFPRHSSALHLFPVQKGIMSLNPRKWYCILYGKHCYRVINYLWLEGRGARVLKTNWNNTTWTLVHKFTAIAMISSFFIPLFLNFWLKLKIYIRSRVEKHYHWVVNMQNGAPATPPVVLFLSSRTSMLYSAFYFVFYLIPMFCFFFLFFFFFGYRLDLSPIASAKKAYVWQL